jgi:hypothetical protein
MQILKLLSFVEEARSEGGRTAETPLRKVAVAGIVANPFAGQPYVDDLSPLIESSIAVGREIAEYGVGLMGGLPIESYGKGAIVGVAGEQEHGVAMLTTVYGNVLREAVGGGVAWISSATKVGCLGTSIDIPLAYKDALFVRSHYDAMSVTLHSAPRPDEMAIICCFANRGRLNDRVGGITTEEATGKDGLR